MNKLPIAIIIAAVILGGSFYFVNQEKSLPLQEVGERAIKFINENLLQGATASLVGVTEENGVYKIVVNVNGNEYNSFATKDGQLLFPEGHTLAGVQSDEVSSATGPAEKRDRPDVKLFIMSYCPFGLQVQKAYLPVYDLLKDKADMGVYFVDYIMHEKKEMDENIRQYCIQKEEKEKYSSYLACFTGEDDYGKCLSQAGINVGLNNNCFFETDRDFSITSNYNNKDTWLNGTYPKFNIHADLNDQYGVGGSPTIIINDQVVALSSRSPEAFKQIVCQAFNTPPEECSQTLSAQVTATGFGGGTGASGGSCQ